MSEGTLRDKSLREEIAKELYLIQKGIHRQTYEQAATWEQAYQDNYYRDADAILALLKPRFEEIREIADTFSMSACELSDNMKKITALCAIEDSEPEEEDEELLRLTQEIVDIVGNTNTQSGIALLGLNQIVKRADRIMQLIREEKGNE